MGLEKIGEENLMDTRAIAREVRLRHWAELINARNASGKTVRAWCVEQGISAKTYYYRQNQLRRAACPEPGESLVPGGFAEVRVSPAPFPGTSARGEIRIEAAGLRITADSAYPAGNLAELIRGVAAPC